MKKYTLVPSDWTEKADGTTLFPASITHDIPIILLYLNMFRI